MNDFIEQQIITAIRGLLSGRVNELLGEMDFYIPLVEFTNFTSGNIVAPIVEISSCERTEKERIIFIDAYAVTVIFNVPETPESEKYCFAYAAAFNNALRENPTLGGVADRAQFTGRKHQPPKNKNCGQEWQLVIKMRVTVETMSN
jgi:hypothetical protein